MTILNRFTVIDVQTSLNLLDALNTLVKEINILKNQNSDSTFNLLNRRDIPPKPNPL